MSANDVVAAPDVCTVWDVLFSVGERSEQTWASGFGGPAVPARLAAPDSGMPSGATGVVRRRLVAALRAELERDRLLDRFGDVCQLYRALVTAAEETAAEPGTRQRVVVGPLSKSFRHVVDLDVLVEDVTVLVVSATVELALQLPVLELGVADGCVVSAGPGDLTATATMAALGEQAWTRTGSAPLSGLLAIEGRLRLISPELPRQDSGGRRPHLGDVR